ncbi:hypothetical protein FPZ24_04925 [Sphingomonas panacisoli]|uniref:Uncharacterized protein n=1 Tax=Sphingomonas panacisoli TaxID=1813879 RepID=A0A5B8LFS0_9SPHN|nr:hypothetical protein [Sphingomonas panacisoli]QDZ06903.1 hypothetical protein FPZ24_04925 [Sphingomonas panacisoli]
MATAAAAAIAKARRDIQHEFFSRDAVRPERAISIQLNRHIQRRVFARWQREGIIREEAGRYWLDVVAYDVDLRKRHKRVLFALFIIILLTLVGLAAGLLRPIL